MFRKELRLLFLMVVTSSSNAFKVDCIHDCLVTQVPVQVSDYSIDLYAVACHCYYHGDMQLYTDRA